MDATQLIEKYVKTAEDFTFEVGTGDTLKARVVADAAEILALEAKAKQLIEVCRKRPAPHWRDYLPTTNDVIRMAVYCEALMIDPPMRFVDGLQMAKTCGLLLPEIAAAVMGQAAIATEEAEEEGIDQAKNA